MEWCKTYFVRHIKTVDGMSLTPEDLYGARCGALHTSSPVSKIGLDGRAREIWYQFQGRTGARLTAALPQLPLVVNIEALAYALKLSGLDFCADLNRDRERFELAHSRANSFLRWGMLVTPDSPPSYR